MKQKPAGRTSSSEQIIRDIKRKKEATKPASFNFLANSRNALTGSSGFTTINGRTRHLMAPTPVMCIQLRAGSTSHRPSSSIRTTIDPSW